MENGVRKSTHIELYPLLSSIAAATDLISRVLVNHHDKVSFVAASLGKALGLDAHSLNRLILAAAVHDIGGLSIRTRLESFDFEVSHPDRHTLPGALLLAGFSPFADLARFVRYHHVYWQNGKGAEEEGEEVPLLSHIIHLADRIAVKIDPEREILSQMHGIVEQIQAGSGSLFVPDQVEAFLEVAGKEAFWLDLTSLAVSTILRERFPLEGMDLDRDELLELSEMFRRVIDFRSRFTATHSSGVAAVAVALAEKCGFEQANPDRMKMAGALHDIGKLVVPAEILEKDKPLVSEDFAVIFKHPYFSAGILSRIGGFADISEWGALHHERLDGSGYPYRRRAEEIPLGARILAVADTFTALMEDRPYRCGSSIRSTARIMRDMAEIGKIDKDLVGLISGHILEMEDRRHDAQTAADQTHRQFLAGSGLLAGHVETDDKCPVKDRAGTNRDKPTL